MGKGSNTTTSTSTNTPAGSGYTTTALNTAQAAAQTPYQAYGGELTAPVNSQQQTGIGGINASAGLAQPYYNTAQSYATNAGAPLTAAQIQQYQNPYTQSVVDATQNQFNNQNQQQLQQVKGNAALQGALGGNREAVAEANVTNQQQLAQAPVIAGLYNQSYAQGLQTAQQQQAQQGSAAAILGGLGTGNENAALSGAGAQLGAGTLEQQTSQSQDTAAYQQYLNQLAYPFQTSQFLTGSVAALTPGLGGTTTGSTTGPPPSLLGQILGAGTAAASFLPSDERVKENIEKIGKLFDGSNIYRFQYKGDPTTRIGLIAQEVEKNHPEAVAHSAGGMKMVDHNRATEDSAERKHFAGGGVALPYSNPQPNQFGSYVPTAGNFMTTPTQQQQFVKPMAAQQGVTGDQWKQAAGIGQSLYNYGQNAFSSPVPSENMGGGQGIADAPSAEDWARGGAVNRAPGGRIGYDGGGFVMFDPTSTATQPQLPPPPPPKQNNQSTPGLGSLANMANGTGLFGGAGAGADAAGAAGAGDAAGGAGAAAGAGEAAGADSVADLLPLLLMAKRGGRIKGYDDGGLVPSQDDATGYDSLAAPKPVSLALPTDGFGDDPKIAPTDGFGDDPKLKSPSWPISIGRSNSDYDPATYAPTNKPVSLVDAAHLNTGAPVGPIQDTPGFDPIAPQKEVATGVAPIAPATASDLSTPTSGYADSMEQIAAAHRQIESANRNNPNGNYAAVGPANPKDGDHAYGAYQVMGKNIPVWTKEVLGQSLTPQQFLASKEAQDAVYKAKMGSYINQYGLDGALHAWLGPASKDFTGTSQDAYRNKFYAALNGTSPDNEAKVAQNSRFAQSAPSSGVGDNFADRHGLSNPFGGSLSQQSGNKTGTNSDSDAPSWWPFGKLSDATKQQLFATGMGMMASKSPFLGNVIGEGGQAGISAVQKAQELSRQADLARSEIALQTAQTGKTNVETQAGQMALHNQRVLQGLEPAAAATTSPPPGKQPIVPLSPGQQSSAGQPGLQAQASAAGPISDSQASGVVQQGRVPVSPTGQPLFTPGQLFAKANNWALYGNTGQQAAAGHLFNMATQMMKTGLQPTETGAQPLPGVAEAQARAASMKTDAEESVKSHYNMREVQPTPGGPTELRSVADLIGSNPAGGFTPAPPPSAAPAVVTPGMTPSGSAPAPSGAASPNPGAGSPPGGALPPGAAPVIAKQPEVFAERQKAIAKDVATMNDQFHVRQVARERLQEIQDILKTYQPGAFAQQKASFVSGLRGLGIPISDRDTANPAAFEMFLKNATKNVFDDVKGMGGRVLVSEIQGLTRANANPELQPQAARAIVGQGLGLLKYEDKHYGDFMDWYNKNPYTIDTSQFEIPWSQRPENQPRVFTQEGQQNTPVLGEQIPASEHRETNKVYMTPKGPMRWMGGGWSPAQ